MVIGLKMMAGFMMVMVKLAMMVALVTVGIKMLVLK